MKIVIYGLGSKYKKYAGLFQSEDIVAVCDKDIANKALTAYRFITPEKLNEIQYDLIVVTSSKYYLEICSELVLKHNIDWKCVIDLEYYQYVINGEMIKKNWGKSFSLIVPHSKTAKQLIELPKGCEINSTMNRNPLRRDVFNCNGVWLNVSKLRRSYCNFVVAHKPYKELNSEDYKTVWVGDISAKSKNGIVDSSGDNISKYNALINECTALYWIWKNDTSDIVGLSHYRRFFLSVVNPDIPVMKWEACQLLKYTDIIVAESVYHAGYSNLEQLRMTAGQECVEETIDILRKAISLQNESDLMVLEAFLSAKSMYPCNMFIMRRKHLEEYCSWLFPILFYMIEHVEIKKEWSSYSKRILGFWAERLFSVWLLKTNYTVKELSIIQTDFNGSYGKDS